MLKKVFLFVALLINGYSLFAQLPLQAGNWRAILWRTDGNQIVFNLEVAQQKGKMVFYVINGQERLLVNDISTVRDSVHIDMPVFESSFKVKLIGKDSLNGFWTKRGALKNTVMPFTASAKQKYRFESLNGDAKANVAGKWQISFLTANGPEPAIGNFVQKGNAVTGSILTPFGDYRFLAGTIGGDLMQLSTFDGNHAMLFTAKVAGDSIVTGKSYSSDAAAGNWVGKRDEQVQLPAEKLTKLKDTNNAMLDFTFADLDGKMVSIKDERFKNKVVVIQLMGSWCPNCMDETAFMTEYYSKNKQRGIEMIGLAYEYTTDLERSKASLRKLQKKFNIQYPLLITPVAITDSLRTLKTLPQLTDIKVFPTTLILDKEGKVVEISSDFFGPGTGIYFTRYKEKFEKKINALLKK
ncbi:TlpA family protein disulfide reductase [Pedobacter sp. MC2016-14]|uniref:peroxiredoxin family protein n=1 Tax=Pedobacter sp. MC2016-14 TaxID=2897327 RepID=UPI001E3F15BB|nr:TlpA disulfide reductase family protein [Pedobacter sp. MC2016-14]MCD0489816.1 TlpA family protein disulfide reductase [Pedobacter sp. MC2016-14]